MSHLISILFYVFHFQFLNFSYSFPTYVPTSLYPSLSLSHSLSHSHSFSRHFYIFITLSLQILLHEDLFVPVVGILHPYHNLCFEIILLIFLTLSLNFDPAVDYSYLIITNYFYFLSIFMFLMLLI